MNMQTTPRSRQNDLIVQHADRELLIYDLKTYKAYCLNETSAIIYQLCDGTKSVTEITRLVGETFKQPFTEDLVWLAVDQLKRDSLLSNGEDVTTKFEGLSRREAIRKVGFASMIALPVVLSLVAPVLAQQASACVCVNPGACLTQTTCPSTSNCNGSGICAP